MRAAEILRKLADIVDSAEQQPATDELGRSPGSDGGDVMSNTTMQRMDPVPEPENDTGDDDKMVPPLQAKIEILKKSEGLPNVYDSCDAQEEDELSALKKRAGLTTAQQEASEDNDLVG